MYMKKNLEVINAEIAKQEIEQGKELSMREKVSAYLALHAAEHFAAACEDVELSEVEELLNNIKKEDGIFWCFTSPTIGGTNPKTGKPNPTKEEYEDANKDAVRCDILDSRQWYKKPRTLRDATDIVSLVSGWNRYQDATTKGKDKLIAQLKKELAEAFMADDFDKANKIKSQLKELEK